MNRVMKIFATGPEQDQVAGLYTILEKYEGFVLADVPAEQVPDVSKSFLAEDITDLYAITIHGQQLDTSHKRIDELGKTLAHPSYKSKEEKTLSKGKHHYLVQFIGPIKKEWLAGVKKAGGELRDPFSDFTYIVRTAEENIQQITALPYVRWAGHLPYDARIERTLLEKSSSKRGGASTLPRTRLIPDVYTIEFFGPEDVTRAVPAVKKLGFKILVEDAKAKILIVESTKEGAQQLASIKDLSTVHGIRKIRERAVNRTSNDVAAGIMGTASSMATGLKLSGKGETIGICDTGIDTGDPAHIHQDFQGRVSYIKSYPITPDFTSFITNPGGNDGAADLDSGHGTHVAGSVLGSGAGSAGLPDTSGPVRGLAYKAKLVFQAVEQEMKWKNPGDLARYGRYLLAGIPTDLSKLFQDAYAKGARIHSNSWGGGKPGEYDEQCRQLDQFVWDKKDFCVLVAAGNDGTDKDGDGKINFTSVTSPATSKNCITVGACENRRTEFNSERYGKWWPSDYPSSPFKNAPMADNPDQVAAFSSRGPTRDNRLKPEVVAPGTFILSTRSTMIALNNTAWAPFPPSRQYFYMGGTSMATPLTAGAVTLIREYLRTKKKIKSPSAALLKAALIAGATRLPGITPAGAIADNHQGYGRVNIDAVLAVPGPATSNFLDMAPGLTTGAVHSVTIQLQSGSVPLRVVLAFTDYPGSSLINNLNLIVTAPDGKKWVGNQRVGGPVTLDATNNVEVIDISNPVTGSWRIDVIGANIPKGPQDFALVYIGHVAG